MKIQLPGDCNEENFSHIDVDAGIATIKIIGATNKLKSLIGTSCIISVR